MLKWELFDYCYGIQLKGARNISRQFLPQKCVIFIPFYPFFIEGFIEVSINRKKF